MKIRNVLWSAACIFLVLPACKKKDMPPNQNPPVVSDCLLKKEATTLSGNERTWYYTYHADHTLDKVESGPTGHAQNLTQEIGNTSILSTQSNGIITTINYNGPFTGTPGMATWDFTENGITRNQYKMYFEYNSQGQVISVTETTDFPGDYEYIVGITYNAAGNVIKLQYNTYSGPGQDVPPVTVNAFDDKPTPYANIPAWRFLNIRFGWDNYDPEPIITALSRNNPLDYTTGTGTSQYVRSMTYEYNQSGFPTKRFNTQTNVNGSYAFQQTWEYDCP